MKRASLVLTVHDVATPLLMADCMAVMDAAFDPAFGEAWTSEQVRSMLDLPGTRLVAGRVGDAMVGFGLIRSIAGEAELLLLGVKPSARRRGYGRNILDRCITIAEMDGAKTMFLEVREGNDAVALYRSAHFEQYSCRRDYYLGRDGQRRSALSFRRAIGHP
ncbi:MAG TPA: GNAT family N-acetyltransferase [Sphingobium sp.]|nr:GNAT family N-acetyltransferase [Sphingobium sp.]